MCMYLYVYARMNVCIYMHVFVCASEGKGARVDDLKDTRARTCL